MGSTEGPPYIRLVKGEATTDAAAVSSPERPPSRARQLSFPYPESTTALLVQVGNVDRQRFEGLLAELKPRWVIDVRAVPRLDTLATSRSAAFALFERSKAAYVDLLGRLDVKSYRSTKVNPAFWTPAITDAIVGADKKGPYLFLFDNDELMAAADRELPRALTHLIGRTASVTTLNDQ